MFRGWPERQTYPGRARRNAVPRRLDRVVGGMGTPTLEELRDAGDRVVATCRQRGRSKATGLPAEMHFAQVWTMRDWKQFRIEMYASPGRSPRSRGAAGVGPPVAQRSVDAPKSSGTASMSTTSVGCPPVTLAPRRTPMRRKPARS